MDNVNFTLALLQVSGNLSFLDKHYTALINDERIKRHRRAKELEYIFASLQNVTRQLNTFVEEQFEMFFQAPIQTPDEIDEENLKDVMQTIMQTQDLCYKTFDSLVVSEPFEHEMFIAKSVEGVLNTLYAAF